MQWPGGYIRLTGLTYLHYFPYFAAYHHYAFTALVELPDWI
jgi:hypothetical protein